MEGEGQDEVPLHKWLDTRDHSLKNCRKSCDHCRYHELNEKVLNINTVLIAITCVFTIANFVLAVSDW